MPVSPWYTQGGWVQPVLVLSALGFMVLSGDTLVAQLVAGCFGVAVIIQDRTIRLQ